MSVLRSVAESPPRLCMVVHGPYPISEPRVEREVQVALREGYEVDVIAMRRAGEPATEADGSLHVLRLPLSHVRARGFAGMVCEYIGFTLLASAKILRRSLRRPYSIVQIHNPPDFVMLAALIPKCLGSRVIFDIHDFAPDLFAARFEGVLGARVAVRVLRFVERAAARFADAVLTVHEPYRRELAQRGVPAGKISVVLNSLDEQLIPRRPTRPGRRAFRVVYHGTLTPHYGLDLLVEACGQIANEMPELRLEIYGEGDTLSLMRARADELGISGQLNASPRYLPLPAVLEKIDGAAVGVISNLPIDRNALVLPTKLFEYIALGIPVVSADLPTICAHFSNDEILYFRAGDVEALAVALLDVAHH